MKNIIRPAIVLFFLTSACKTAYIKSSPSDDGKIELVFLQVNDVYEIAPLSGGKEGGMARVASLKKQLLQQNPNTLLVMAGDFVSPSVYNSLQYEGKRIRGKQMIEAMNVAGMDIAVFGNHEFDITESELQERIDESEFLWVASNTFHKVKDTVIPFSKSGRDAYPFPKAYIMDIKDDDGTTARIGIIGLTLPFNKADYVSYTDPLTTATELYDFLKDSVEAVIAITHQLVDEDIALAKRLPKLTAILGGHEHDMRFEKQGNVFITKAHANAKSAYAVTLKINRRRNRVDVDPRLVMLDESVPLDPATNAVVEKWTDIAEKNYSSLGFDARKIVLGAGDPLDGRESEIRNHPTNLTRLIMAAISATAPEAQVAIMNAGSIRVDDMLVMPMTQYDIIRTLPFGGGIREVDMKGATLLRTLDQGRKNIGIGGYLLYNEAVDFNATSETWTLKGSSIDPDASYRVAVTEFLLSGKEANLDFLNPSNMVKVYEAETNVSSPMSDVRLAIIRYLEKARGTSEW